MATNIINFREERDLGQTLNVTFGFIRQNFKLLLNCVLYFVLPFALLASIFISIYQTRLQQAASGDLYYRPWGEYGFFQTVTSFNYLVGIFLSFVSIVVMSLAIYSSMVQYMDNQGQVSIRQVWQDIKSHLLTALYSSVGIFLLCAMGLVLLLVPGIYLVVVFSLFFMVMMREELGFIETVERCFYLIKGNWWNTLGLILIIALVQGLISMVAYLPAGLLLLLKAFEIPGADNNLLQVIFNGFAAIISISLYVISIIAIGFHYFNLVEMKDGIGLIQQVELIGKTNWVAAADDLE